MRKRLHSFARRSHYHIRRRLPSPRLPQHPFVMPVSLFLAAFLIGCAGFISVNARTLSPSDSHVVQLLVDGQKQNVPTRAATVGELVKRLDISLQKQDLVQPALDSAITEDNFQVNVYRAKPVTIVDQGKQITTLSPYQAPVDIVTNAGLTVYPEDKVQATPPDNVLKDGLVGQKVVVDRATLTGINLYGNQIDLRTRAKTVGQLLAEKNIKPLAGDTITPSLETVITAQTRIFIVRMGKQIDTREEIIASPVETTSDPNVLLGRTEVRDPGVPGKKLVTYEVELQNGREISRKVLQEVVASQPTKKVVVRGTKVPVVAVTGDKGAILTAAGVSADQHFAADFVIAHESGWRLTARNASGCLGLGQACPGTKLMNACPEWQTDAVCQVRFFSGYANGRYGSWQGAYNFWQINHWW